MTHRGKDVFSRVKDLLAFAKRQQEKCLPMAEYISSNKSRGDLPRSGPTIWKATIQGDDGRVAIT